MLIIVLQFHLHFQQCPFTMFFHETMDNSSNIWFFILAPLCVTFCKLFLYLLGDWLEGLEWTDVIMNAKIRTSGSSGAILSATHVKKTRYFHQVNVAVLYSLLKEKFDDSEQRDFEEWIDIYRKESPHFQFCYTLLELEWLMLTFVRSLTWNYNTNRNNM